MLSAPVERRSRLSPVFSRAAATTLEPIAQRRLALALATLSRGRVVVTDRLHGHILATLAGIPNVVLDSASGKSRAVHQSWTAPCRIVRYAEDVGAAEGAAAELLAGLSAAA
jgi:pyruvyl transferase EpsO